MKIYPDELIEHGLTYKMELHFPGLSWIIGQAVKIKILGALDAYDIGASWTIGPVDTWFLTYHLKAAGRNITHGSMFDYCILGVCDRAMWIDCIELGEIEPIFTPDPGQPLPEWIPKTLQEIGANWKLLVGAGIATLVLLVALKSLPYGRRGK